MHLINDRITQLALSHIMPIVSYNQPVDIEKDVEIIKPGKQSSNENTFRWKRAVTNSRIMVMSYRITLQALSVLFTVFLDDSQMIRGASIVPR